MSELQLNNASVAVASQLHWLQPFIAHQPARLLAGLTEHYSLANRGNIPSQWQNFLEQKPQLSPLHPNRHFGVALNADAACNFDYFVGCEVGSFSNLAKPFVSHALQAGRAVVFPFEGHVSELAQFIDRIWTQWLPAADLALAGGKCIEYYSERFNLVTGQQGMEVWLPLQ